MQLSHILAQRLVGVFLIFLFVCTACNAIKLRGSIIVDQNGSPLEIHGMNFFGFNNGQTMVDGLWSNNALSGDFATVVRRQKLLGFNAVRIPFSFKDFELAPRSFVHQSCPLPSDEEVAASVTPSGATVRGPAPRLPNPPPASSYAGDVCNAYLPSASVRERLLWVADFYARNGFVVLLDNHLREDQTALQDESKWVASWASLANDIYSRPSLRNAVIFDLLNEPDSFGMRWEQLGPMYLRVMSAIDQVTAGEAIYAIEGTGQAGLNANWGDGFATTKISELGLSDPRPFFDALLGKPYVDRVILAPHVYPPSVTYNYNAVTGNALYDRLDTSFGKKRTDGYCDGSSCQRFPVLVGEFGSRLEAAKDLESLRDLAVYIKGGDLGWYWWSWNANSGDTGGLVSDDWRQIEWKKINFLQTIGLEPWANGGNPMSPTPAISPSSPASPTTPSTPTSPQPPASPSSPSSPTSPSSPAPSSPSFPSSPTSPSSPSAPTPSTEKPSDKPTPTSPISPTLPTDRPAPNPPTPPGASPANPKPSKTSPYRSPCQVKIKTENVWSNGDSSYSASFKITIKNKGSKKVSSPWKLTLRGGTRYSKVPQSWGWHPSIKSKGRMLEGMATEDWLSIDARGGEASVGLQVTGRRKTLRPKQVRLNGVKCRLV